MVEDPNVTKQKEALKKLIGGFIAIFFIIPIVFGSISDLAGNGEYQIIGRIFIFGLIGLFFFIVKRGSQQYKDFAQIIKKQLESHDNHFGEPKTAADFPQDNPAPIQHFKNKPTKPGDTI
jgi:hypothetical protein